MFIEKILSLFGTDEQNEVIKQRVVLENITTTFNITKTYIPNSLGLIRDFAKDSNSNEKKVEKALIPLAKKMGIKNTKSTETILDEILSFVNEVNKETETLSNVVEKDFSKLAPLSTITSKQSGILGLANVLLSSALFLEDFFVFLTYKIGDDKLYYKVKEKEVMKGIEAFSKLYKFYRGNVKKRILDLHDLSDTEVGDSVATFRANASGYDKEFNFPIDNFTSSPIYFVRKWWVDLMVTRNEAMVDKKQLMELKLLELKSRANGEQSINLQEQIEYYEKKITKYEASIKDFEEEE